MAAAAATGTALVVNPNAVNELKHLRPLWDDFIKRANKFNGHARLFLRAMSSFSDSLEAISHAASGLDTSIANSLQLVSTCQRSLEFKCRSLQTAFNDRLLRRLSDHVAVWRARTEKLDRMYAKSGKADHRRSQLLGSLCQSKTVRFDKQKCLQEAAKEFDHQIHGFFSCLRPVLQAQATMASDFKRLSELVAGFDPGPPTTTDFPPPFELLSSGSTAWNPNNKDVSRSSFFSSDNSVNNQTVVPTSEPMYERTECLVTSSQQSDDVLNTSTCTAPTLWRRSSRYQRLAPKPVAVPRIPSMNCPSSSTSLTTTTITDAFSNYGPGGGGGGGGSSTYDRLGTRSNQSYGGGGDGATHHYSDSSRLLPPIKGHFNSP